MSDIDLEATPLGSRLSSPAAHRYQSGIPRASIIDISESGSRTSLAFEESNRAVPLDAPWSAVVALTTQERKSLFYDLTDHHQVATGGKALTGVRVPKPYGLHLEKVAGKPVIGDVEMSGAGNSILRVGRYDGYGWQQTMHVVLSPDERDQLIDLLHPEI
jgi:hypothetical protein